MLLPKFIIEYILDKAELPRWVRLEFIEIGFQLTPVKLPIESPIDQDLYYQHLFQEKDYTRYRNLKKKEKKYPSIIKPVYTLCHCLVNDFEIRIIEKDDDYLFQFERVVIDYETEDLHVIRKTVCNMHTGKLMLLQ
jgi:hypothetical protein